MVVRSRALANWILTLTDFFSFKSVLTEGLNFLGTRLRRLQDSPILALTRLHWSAAGMYMCSPVFVPQIVGIVVLTGGMSRIRCRSRS